MSGDDARVLVLGATNRPNESVTTWATVSCPNTDSLDMQHRPCNSAKNA
jgi:hypothetical protein